MVCITVPLMLCIEWLLKNGAFNFWEQYVPDQVNRFFPAELVSVVAAQMGGLVQSSAVAANLRAEGLIDNAQILLAMLVGERGGQPLPHSGGGISLRRSGFSPCPSRSP